jgi:4'-phosphopantetheinyl transferase
MRPRGSGRGYGNGVGLSLDENDAAGNAAADMPQMISLSSPEAHVRLGWCALHATDRELRSCAAVLSKPEHDRAARFGSPLLRDRYMIGRAALRNVLGDMLGLAPARVPIVRGPRGRPQLGADVGLDFNVSHTEDGALLGVLTDMPGARIGVDVERGERRINVAGIARKFMSDNERKALAALDEERARRTVLQLWTCKEAMSKATGDALSAPFASIDVELSTEAEVRDGPGKYRPEDWALHAASVPGDYIATIALWRP